MRGSGRHIAKKLILVTDSLGPEFIALRGHWFAPPDRLRAPKGPQGGLPRGRNPSRAVKGHNASALGGGDLDGYAMPRASLADLGEATQRANKQLGGSQHPPARILGQTDDGPL